MLKVKRHLHFYYSPLSPPSKIYVLYTCEDVNIFGQPLSINVLTLFCHNCFKIAFYLMPLAPKWALNHIKPVAKIVSLKVAFSTPLSKMWLHKAFCPKCLFVVYAGSYNQQMCLSYLQCYNTWHIDTRNLRH